MVVAVIYGLTAALLVFTAAKDMKKAKAALNVAQWALVQMFPALLGVTGLIGFILDAYPLESSLSCWDQIQGCWEQPWPL